MSLQPPRLPVGDLNIALSFSGGGFRAASFTLGCASYLNHVIYNGSPLLHRVRFISSASGGSITNLVLSSMLRKGKTFDDVYLHLINKMRSMDLMDRVFTVLNDDKLWKLRPAKTRNLINAFAMVYDMELFEKACFDTLWKRPPHNSFVIDEVCVNATDFDNGLNFRFQTAGKIGNQFLYFSKKPVAGKIKLGDILACSSCFPAGFEPFMFPLDFTWKEPGEELSESQLIRDIVQKNNYSKKQITDSVKNRGISFGLMDGGIDDNQGIYAFLLSDDRKKGFDYDLYFPCDVSSNYLGNPFQYPPKNTDKLLLQSIEQIQNRWKKKAKWYLGGCGAVCIASAALATFGVAVPVFAALSGIAFAAGATPVVGYRIIKKKIKKLINGKGPDKDSAAPNTWKTVFNKYKHHFANIRVDELLQMLQARFTSVLLLADTIYLKKIRRISYNQLFSEKSNDVYAQLIKNHNDAPSNALIDTGKLWNDHVAVTPVYLLATKNNHELQKLLKEFETIPLSATNPRTVQSFLEPSDKLRVVIDIATEMETTLWFDENHSKNNCLESLVAAGQATMCFNLIRTSYRFGNTDVPWMSLRNQLLNEWASFQTDPYWLYNQEGARIIPGFQSVSLK